MALTYEAQQTCVHFDYFTCFTKQNCEVTLEFLYLLKEHSFFLNKEQINFLTRGSNKTQQYPQQDYTTTNYMSMWQTLFNFNTQ